MTTRVTVDTLTELALPEQPALSPDGEHVVYVLRTVDAAADRTLRNLWRRPVAGGAAVRLTRGGADTTPRFSPDGTRLLFLRAKDGPAQIWQLPSGGGEPEQLTTLPLGAGAPVWSPDGGAIAFSAPVDIAAASEEDDAARKRRAQAPIVTDRLDYQADGAGLLRTMRTHIHVLDPASGECRQVTEGDWHAGEPAWSPDGTKLAFAGASGDLEPRAPVFVLDVADHAATPVRVGLADGFGGPVLWTPDGGHVLVVGHRGAPVGHAGLLRLAIDDGSVRDLAAPLDRNVMPGGPGYPGALPVVIDDGRTVLFCARDGGCTHLYAVDLDGGTPRLVLGGEARSVSRMSVQTGTAAVVLSTATAFADLVTVDLASSVETVHDGAELDLLPRVPREFAISDGTVVQGWLVRNPDADGPQPLLLDIHGGPHNAWNGAADDVHLYHQELARRGWTILLVNPRASDGYGAAFYEAAIELFARAALIAQDLGHPPLHGVAVGGASDGNFTAGVGTPTLDGLGAVGGGAHADDEHVLIAELAPRTELLRALLADLLTSGATKAPAAAGTDRP